MRPTVSTAAIGLVAATLAAPSAQAAGLLGERYVSALVGQVHTGDDHLQDYDDTYFALEGKVNVPVAEHVDLGFRYGRESLDGSHHGTDLEETEQVYLGEATYHFRPEDHHYNPFVRVRAGMVSTEVDEDGDSHSEDDAAYAVAAGADLGIGEHAAVAPEVAYRVVDGDGEVIAGAEANYWLGERAFLLAKVDYRNDEGDFGYFAGAGYHF